MKQARTPQQPKTRSAVAVAAWNRPGGVHKDQRRKHDHRALRRDKSYRNEA